MGNRRFFNRPQPLTVAEIVSLTGAQFGAFFYNVENDQGNPIANSSKTSAWTAAR